MAQLNTLPDSKLLLGPFLRLPSKKLFADYYQIIETPVSLAEIKARNAKSEYATLQDLYSDFKLMRDNAIAYNEQGSDIANAASLILKTAEDYIIQATLGEEAASYASELEQSELRIMDDLAKHKQGRRLVAELFIDKPSKEEYPDYYKIIPNPTSINTIKEQIQHGRARTSDAFKEIVEVMFTNALIANEETSQVVADAKMLQKLFNSRFEKMAKTLPPAPTGYDLYATKLMEGSCSEEAGLDEKEDTEAKAGTPLKLRIKPVTKEATPRLKLNIKGRKKESAEPDTATEAEDEGPAESEEVKDEGSNQPDPETEDAPAPEDTAEDNAEETKESVETQGETTTTELAVPEVADARKITRDPKTSSEALIKSLVISSVIPVTSKYHLQKAPPPAALLNLFQLTVPASPKYTVRSFSFTVPAYHQTVNVNSTIHELLNHQYYEVVLSHNYRQVKQYSSSTSSPWADADTPITHKYEIGLATGLNLVELTVFTQPGRKARHGDGSSENDVVEKVSLWITRMRS